MTETATATADIRTQILEDPSLILDDHELMRALLAADRSALGRNVVDLRGVLVDRLEERLDRLEDTHREVLAAAYENVAGTNQVHRACLALLEPADFAGFLRVLTREVAPIVAVETIRLGLEATGAARAPEGAPGEVVVTLPARGADSYVTQGRGLGARRVTLRPVGEGAEAIYGAEAVDLRSEALIRLDLGDGQTGLLAFGATDASRFHPDQGTDLLAFLGGVFERALRRWLA